MFQLWTKASRDVLYFHSLFLLYAIHYEKSIAQMAMDSEQGDIRDRLDPSLQLEPKPNQFKPSLAELQLTQVRNKCLLKILSFGVVVVHHHYCDNCLKYLIYPTMPYKSLHDLHTSPPFISVPSFWELSGVCKCFIQSYMFYECLYHVIKLINLYI